MAAANTAVEELIRRFGLEPHPEGGYYSETYRADKLVRRDGAAAAEGTRAASTAIYFLLAEGAYSAWHRIRSDELWHFYAGSPLEIHSIDERGVLSTRKLGHALDHPGTVFQAVVPAGHWSDGSEADRRIASPGRSPSVRLTLGFEGESLFSR